MNMRDLLTRPPVLTTVSTLFEFVVSAYKATLGLSKSTPQVNFKLTSVHTTEYIVANYVLLCRWKQSTQTNELALVYTEIIASLKKKRNKLCHQTQHQQI